MGSGQRRFGSGPVVASTARALLALYPLLVLAGGAAGQNPDPASWQRTLERHVATMGRIPPFLVVRATIRSEASRTPVTTFVRATPFGFRREIARTDNQPGRVWITDGRHAWDDAGVLLDPLEARSCFEFAFIDGLLYRASNRLAAGPDTKEPWALRDHANLPPDCPRNLRTHWVGLMSPAGTMPQFHFDANDATLVEIAVTDIHPATTWTRYLDWRDHAGVRLPMRQVMGILGQPVLTETHVDSVDLPDQLPDALFAGNPVRPLPNEGNAGGIEVVAGDIPGSAHFVLPTVELDLHTAAIGLLDTGATRSTITRELAGALGIPQRSNLGITTLTSNLEVQAGWLHRLALGSCALDQFVVAVMELPVVTGQPADRQPSAVIGTDMLFAGSPVFDLQRGRVSLRGRPTAPLAAPAGSVVITLPLHRSGNSVYVDVRVGEATVRALLDTGSPFVLRLDPTSLRQLGLPATRAEWTAAGALPLPTGEAGGKSTLAHVLQLPAFALGAAGQVLYTNAAVQVSDAEAAPGTPAAIVGAGALRTFLRIGLDLERNLLELERPTDDTAGNGVCEIAGAGRFAGCSLLTPPVGTRDGRLLLPRVGHVAAGSPAHRAGLRDGDFVLRIDGQATAAMRPGEASRRLWLDTGRAVVLDVLDSSGKARQARIEAQ
jgi:hypothetical protein